MRVLIYNDTTLINSHFGPRLVMETAREQLAKRGVEVVGSLHRDALPRDNSELLSRADLVVVNGEGSIHHGRCAHLLEIASEYPAVLINCVFQENQPHKSLAKFRLIAARESYSAAHLRECGAENVIVVPDLMFHSPTLRNWRGGEPTQDIGITDNVLDRQFGFQPFADDPTEYLKWLSSHRRVVCGRFHAAVACCVLGIPFSCWPSNTWKTEGMLEDMGLPHLCCKTQEEAVRQCPIFFNENTKLKIRTYAATAQHQIEAMFNRIAES
jgi:hypothetical protein